VKIGNQGLIGDAAVWVGLDKGFFKDQGIDLELVPFTSTADILPSLTTGQVDFSSTAANAAMFNATERAVQIKFIADLAIAGPNTRSAAIGVRSDIVDGGKFKGPADLKGLNIASGGPPGASTIDFAIENYAGKGNLTHADLKLTFLPFPQMPAAMANKAVDAAYFVEPFLSAAEQQGTAKMVAYNGDLLRGDPVYVLAISPVFAQAQPALADKFMQGLVKAQRYTYAAFKANANQAEVVKIIQEHQQIKDANLIVRMMDDVVSPDNPIDLKPFSDFEDAYVRYGSVKQKVDINQLVDPSYLQRAVQAAPK
jgi:NitT/TauT family transport system substrate-binding protein